MDVILCTDVFLNNFYSPSLGIRDYRMLLTPHTHTQKKKTDKRDYYPCANKWEDIFSDMIHLLIQKGRRPKMKFQGLPYCIKGSRALVCKVFPNIPQRRWAKWPCFYHKTLILSQNFLQKIQTSAIHLSKSVTKKIYTMYLFYSQDFSETRVQRRK